jgi:hypothetical protein
VFRFAVPVDAAVALVHSAASFERLARARALTATSPLVSQNTSFFRSLIRPIFLRFVKRLVPLPLADHGGGTSGTSSSGLIKVQVDNVRLQEDLAYPEKRQNISL